MLVWLALLSDFLESLFHLNPPSSLLEGGQRNSLLKHRSSKSSHKPLALFARASLAVLIADARPAALLAHAFYAVVIADARPAAWLALASSAVVLADA